MFCKLQNKITDTSIYGIINDIWTYNVYYKAVASWPKCRHENTTIKSHHVFEQVVNVKNKAYFEPHNTRTKDTLFLLLIENIF